MVSQPKKRRLTRYQCHLPVSLCVVGNPKAHGAEVLDLSEGGAKIRCNKTVVHIGDQVEITLGGKEAFQVRAKVAFAEPLEYLIDEDNEASELRWSEDSTGVFGVRFLSLGTEERRRLLALMESIELDEAA